MAPYAMIAALLGALVSLWIPRVWKRARMRHRFRRAREGELAAQVLLQSRGYRILDDQSRRQGHMFVDGERVEYQVRADLLVARWFRTYVVEVKTGKRAPNPNNSATRRQLREYAEVYEVDGLLLADMNAGELHDIHFPHRGQARTGRRMATVFLLGAICGVALAGLLAPLLGSSLGL